MYYPLHRSCLYVDGSIDDKAAKISKNVSGLYAGDPKDSKEI